MFRAWLEEALGKECLVCGGRRLAELLCEACAKWPPVVGPVCEVCGDPVQPHLENCRRCALEAQRVFETVRSEYFLGESSLLLLEVIKLRAWREVAERLLFSVSSLAFVEKNKIAGIVPVPLSSWDYLVRGYNLAGVLAQKISLTYGWPVEEVAVVKRHRTHAQKRLSGRARAQNVQWAFGADARVVEGKTWLVVDDVFTTGATLSAVARELKAKGAKAVLGWTLFRTPLWN